MAPQKMPWRIKPPITPAHSVAGSLQAIQVRTSIHQVRSRTSIAYTWYCCTAAVNMCILYTSTHGLCNFLLGEVSLLFSLRVRSPADDITAATRILTTRVPGISYAAALPMSIERPNETSKYSQLTGFIERVFTRWLLLL